MTSYLLDLTGEALKAVQFLRFYVLSFIYNITEDGHLTGLTVLYINTDVHFA